MQAASMFGILGRVMWWVPLSAGRQTPPYTPLARSWGPAAQGPGQGHQGICWHPQGHLGAAVDGRSSGGQGFKRISYPLDMAEAR